MAEIAAYGTWTSPIGADDVASLGGGPQWVGLFDGHTWWAESRPSEGGRLALCRARPGGPTQEVLPAPWNVRNRLHEYGGRPWTVIGHRVVFTHWDDQRWYMTDPDGDDEPTPLSPTPDRPQGIRYADATAGPDGTELWCVRETATGDAPTDIRRDLVAIPLSGAAAADPGAVRVLAASHHFMSGPKLSPDGTRVAWLGWNHPAMPWDTAILCLAPVGEDGSIGEWRPVAGGPSEAVCQFEWDGADLLALTDPDGWWNLYRIDPVTATAPVNLAPAPVEIGGPLWVLGARWFTPLGDGRYAVVAHGRLAVLDPATGTIDDLDVDMPLWGDVVAADGTLAGVASSPTRHSVVARLDLACGAVTELTAQPDRMPDPAWLPVPTERTFDDEQGRPVPAYVYPPTNPGFAAPEGERPPLVVFVHGGPTAGFRPSFQADIAYFTSRGFAVAGVNYGGSTGYGRAFRERLLHGWGVVDVADCATVARGLAAEGAVDGDRLAIRGGSAGGWTTAASLTSTDTYRCGTVMFPVLELRTWVGQTHDFESRYMERLIGVLPDDAARYDEVSPGNHADRLAGPVLMLQGLEDMICPPAQADAFMAVLAGSGIPHAYLRFEGEQHGFRRAENIQRALEAELSFYGQVLGFTTPGVPVLELAT